MPRKTATEFPGVRYSVHATRKHKRRPDCYYMIRYRSQPGASQVEEGLGWASEGWTAQMAYDILAKIKQAVRTGNGPQNLAAMRREAALANAQPVVLTFGELANRYLAWARTNKKTWDTDTFRCNKHIRPLLGDRPAAGITKTDVEKLRDAVQVSGLSPASVKQVVILVRRIYNWASDTPQEADAASMLFTGRNPAKGVRLPVMDNERNRFLTREEADRLLRLADKIMPGMHDIILLTLVTGMRRQEILGITWQDVDLANRFITIPAALTRAKRSRKAFLDEEAAAMLHGRQAAMRSPFVFSRLDGRPYDRFWVTKRFNFLVDRCGFNDGVTDSKKKVVFHTLRHTFASWLAQAGVDIYQLMELTGHTTISMVLRYTHLMPDRTRAAAALASRHAPPAGPEAPPGSGVS